MSIHKPQKLFKFESTNHGIRGSQIQTRCKLTTDTNRWIDIDIHGEKIYIVVLKMVKCFLNTH